MERLIKQTTAYKIFEGDAQKGRLAHAYMLIMADGDTLPHALGLFAVKAFGFSVGTREEKLVKNCAFVDLKVYPKKEKLSVDDAVEILQDCVLEPVEADKKIYVINGFETASALFQNKLLKVLEEPPKNVYFLLGARTTASVLDTVLSRVNKLEIAPFSPEQIVGALTRELGQGDYSRIAKYSGGSLGEAKKMLSGDWFNEVDKSAKEICSAYQISDVGRLATKYGDAKNKDELLAQIQRVYHDALTDKISLKWSKATLIYAVESVVKAIVDAKFNANFSALLYDLMLGVIGFENRTQA